MIHKTQTDPTDALDESFDLLSDPVRRRIVTRLHDHNPREEVEFTADELAAEGDQIELAIHHHHLPKLADAGFIDWDRDANIVTRGPRFDEIAPLIELMVNHQDELPAGWP